MDQTKKIRVIMIKKIFIWKKNSKDKFQSNRACYEGNLQKKKK